MFEFERWAFVDESGNASLNLENPSTPTHFVVTCVICSKSELEAVRQLALDVSKKFFGGKEIKSSSVGGKDQRREKILEYIAASDMRFFAVVLDKRKVYKDSGLQWKRSFIKFANGLMYNRLFKSMTNLHVRADEHGTREFMQGFERYLIDRSPKDLFESLDFQFVDSTSEYAVGLADFISGTIRRVFEGDSPREFLKKVSKNTILIEPWPPSEGESLIVGEKSEGSEFDSLVSRVGVLSARRFIEENSKEDGLDELMQVEAARYLLYHFELDPNDYVYSQQILDHLNEEFDEDLTMEPFRSRIVGELRTKGVIIASSNKGLKIPNTKEDLENFVSTVDGQVLPYLRRLITARNAFLVPSGKRLDILDGHEELKLIAETLDAKKLGLD